MAAYSRREFGKLVAAGLPAAAFLGGRPLVGAAASVPIGVSTFSFDGLPHALGENNIAAVIAALAASGANLIELAATNLEPGGPDLRETVMGGSPAYPSLVRRSPAELAAIDASARRALRAWRLSTGSAYLTQQRAAFDAAGIAVHALAFDYTDRFTDEEIDATFAQAKAFGVTLVSSPVTMDVAKRLAPLATRANVRIAVHNQIEGDTAAYIGTVRVGDVLALSPVFSLKLDIGNVTTSNGDAVAALRACRDRVSHVLVQDRLRNGGAGQAFGEGDTPIPAVLADLARTQPAVPALAEYRYFGVGSPATEVKHCLDYMRQALKSSRETSVAPARRDEK
jgi:sugar phosphate isomerase/epimerase